LELKNPKIGANKGRLADVENVKRLRDAGHTLLSIATMYGVHRSTVFDYLQRAE
jgi:transposase